MLPLFFAQALAAMLNYIIISCEKEATSATGRVANGLTGLRSHYLNNCLYKWARSEVLTGTRFNILGIFFKQAFVYSPFNIKRKTRPGLGINQANKTAKLGWILNFILSLAKYYTN